MADQLLQLDHSQSASTNLMVARRADRDAKQIVANGSYCCVYSFDGQWTKCPYDGPLFLVARSSQPYLKLLLLNRQSTTNWTQAIELGVSCGADMSSQMLSIRTRDGAVSGCWFHDPTELAAVAKCIKQHLKALKAAAASPSMQPQTAAQAPPPAPQGVMGLLQGASAHATPTKPSYSAAVSTPDTSAPPSSGLHDLLNSAAAAASERVASTTPSAGASPLQGPVSAQGGGVSPVTPLALSKEALKAVMMDMLEEPTFIDELHARFIAHLHQQRGGEGPESQQQQPPQQQQSAKKRKSRSKKKGQA